MISSAKAIPPQFPPTKPINQLPAHFPTTINQSPAPKIMTFSAHSKEKRITILPSTKEMIVLQHPKKMMCLQPPKEKTSSPAREMINILAKAMD